MDDTRWVGLDHLQELTLQTTPESLPSKLPNKQLFYNSDAFHAEIALASSSNEARPLVIDFDREEKSLRYARLQAFG